jgi:glutaredoxin 2
MSGDMADVNKAIEERGFEAIAKEEITDVAERVGNRSEFYRVITPDIFMGGVKEGFIEMIAVSARTDAIEYFISKKQKTELIEEINIKLSPQQAKKLTRWLLRNLILYERAFGETILIDEINPEKLANDDAIKVLDDALNKKLNELIIGMNIKS